MEVYQLSNILRDGIGIVSLAKGWEREQEKRKLKSLQVVK
jgi:hypothetical protein